MQKIQSVVNHIVNSYGFTIEPCRIPKNHFQYLKRGLYFSINNICKDFKIKGDVINFLHHLSPIKFLENRPNGEIWLRKRLREGLFEIEIKPHNPYKSFKSDIKGIFNRSIIDSENYNVKFYFTVEEVNRIEFPINTSTGIKSIDAYFYDIPELKESIREYKLNSILNG